MLSMELLLVSQELGDACLEVAVTPIAATQACGSESHNIINLLNTLTKLTKMIPNNPYTTPFLAASGLVGTLTLDHVNTFVAICVGVLTMVYLGIKIYKEFTKKL